VNDPDNFLSRWSRRKHEAGEHKEKKENHEAASEARAKPAPEREPGTVAPAPDAPPLPKFDPETLPPIESISAETDITAFMRTGVPESLKHAALRRAWSADPAIRDFVGLNENFWDAAGPDGISGFGALDPGLDVKRMVSDLFGETSRQDTASDADRVDATALPIENPSPAAKASGDTEPPPVTEPPPALLPQRNENVAVQPDASESEPEKKIARRHGGAMPQ
jgi:hypothetical protein